MKLHLTVTDCVLADKFIKVKCYLRYRITQCYLPPDTSEQTPTVTPTRQAGIRFTYPEGMEAELT